MPTRAQQRAWREKIGLISIIISIMAFVGFITFGFTAVVCRTPPERLRVNQVGSNYMIFHGLAYDLSTSHHPAAQGIPLRDDGLGANILYDLPKKHGGQDGSFLFQNVNGRCKGVITLAEDSDVPTNDNGDLAWYFPCATFNQDGSTDPNLTVPYYLGYGCHTTSDSRDAFYLDLRDSADVYFTWNDIKNGSRNLVVYSGSVLDLDLLRWFNKSQVQVPDRFQELSDHDSRVNQAVRGRDITRMFQAQLDKKHALCLEEIIKVGSIDADTVGCIASQIVLYISLILILAIVLWFICGKYSPAKAYSSSDQGNRNRQIEEWSDDIYRLPAILPENPGRAVDGSGRKPIRTSFLPTTSRYSSTTEIERPSGHRRPMTTMSTQHLSRQPVQPHSGQKQDNHADGVLESGLPVSNTSYTTAPGPADPTHDAIIPQPPPDWMPFAIRTTLDSIAITDYPNSHKVIVVICDGMIKGKGEMTSTPDACLGMIKDNTVTSEMVQPLSYVAVASGAKRHNMAKVYCGFYDYGTESHIPTSQQQQVPIMLIVKCGTPDEIGEAKPGNRGKRDSQIILMSFLQKVMFDERMTELEYEMFTGLRRVTGILPEFYEITLMVDADTKVFTDSLSHMVSAMVKDPRIMGLCGETKIANKRDSWVTAIQSFESMFGGVTCLPGCFCMYRIKAPKGTSNYWVPILANPDIVEHYSENMVETLHEKNLYLLGEDRYLTTLMLRTFPKRQQVFIPQAVCKTTVPDKFIVLLSQRRRWINSTIHNLMELVLVRDLCGTFCFSMQFIVSVELAATLVLPAAIAFTFYVGKFTALSFPPALAALILGLPGVLVVITAHSWSYILWMLIYLMALPIWNFILPCYAFWKFDDFSWGETRKTAGETPKESGLEYEGEFDSSRIIMKRWAEFERYNQSKKEQDRHGLDKG
ncbi:chitin synthase 4 [Dactylonectria estremocensis]|uniref:chitin synthase n=1 Tax=Dactylonectria estremocensis TaxID=1079267 RepID=A0A9P9EUE8_9HYPO|nr:chitin synthase 4 [Dactylonectria estremocensis]